MKQQEYLDWISRFEASSLTRLEIEEEAFKIRMEKGGQAAKAVPPAPSASLSLAADKDAGTASEEGLIAVKAPLVGVFYAAPSPGDKPFTAAGERVEQGQILCLIEAMKMMNELKSPVSGIVRSVRGVDGQLAEYGQVLFEVAPC